MAWSPFFSDGTPVTLNNSNKNSYEICPADQSVIFLVPSLFAGRLEPIGEDIHLPKALPFFFFFFFFLPFSNGHCSVGNIRDWLLQPKLYLRTNSDFLLQKISKESCDEHAIFSWGRMGTETRRVQPSRLSPGGQFPHWMKSLKLKQSRAKAREGRRGKAGDESLEAFCKCHYSPSSDSWLFPSSQQGGLKPEARICQTIPSRIWDLGCRRLRFWGLCSWKWWQGVQNAWQGPNLTGGQGLFHMIRLTSPFTCVFWWKRLYHFFPHHLPQSISTAPHPNLCQEETSLESLGEKLGSVVSLKAGKFHRLPTDNTSNTTANGLQTQA